MKSFLSHFSRGDFFAVLPPGFYIFMVIYSSIYLHFADKNSNPSILDVITELEKHIQGNPVSIIFIVFICYLLGSLFRAMPVNWAVRSIPPFKASFLEKARLNKIIETVNDNVKAIKHDISKMPVLLNKEETKYIDSHIFNFWKDILCINSIEGFEYYQIFETRVRFFSGIIWASWCGIIGGVYMMFQGNDFFNPVGFPIFLLSFILLASFGMNIRRIREEEAKALLLLYSAYLQQNISVTSPPP